MTDTNNNNNTSLPVDTSDIAMPETNPTKNNNNNNNNSDVDQISIPSQHSSVKNPSLKTADRSDHEDGGVKNNNNVPVEPAENNPLDQNEMVNTGSGANDFKNQNIELNASALNQEEIEDKMRQRREKRRQEKEAAERERKKKELQKVKKIKSASQ